MKMDSRKIGFGLTALAMLGACAGEAPENSPQLASTLCSEPRPEMCSAHYDPVCGLQVDVQNTYSNACTACANPAVQAWLAGQCP